MAPDQLDVVRPGRIGAIALLLVTAALLVWGLVAGSQVPADTFTDDESTSNTVLYETIAQRVADGDDYYTAAIEEQVARDFPTSPAATVRVPTVALIQATLGPDGAYAALAVLWVVALVLVLRRLGSLTATRNEMLGAVVLLVVGAVVSFVPTSVWFHEAWALGIILISLALADGRRWWPSVVVGCLAPFVRELALLYVGVRFLMAVRRHRREAIAWAVGGALFVVFYLWHAAQVAGHQVASPVDSPGWLDLSGWTFIVDSVHSTTLLAVLPHAVAAVVTPFALLGWAFARGELGRLAGATVLAFVVVFCVIGQSGNIYWGLLYAPLLLLGLAFAPRGLSTLARTVRA